jgi:hypothetical protein
MSTGGGLSRRRVAASSSQGDDDDDAWSPNGSATTSKPPHPPSLSAGSSSQAPNVPTSHAGSAFEGGSKIAYDPRDLINQDEEDSRQGGRAPRLTIMEEVLLLGLKDKQASIFVLYTPTPTSRKVLDLRRRGAKAICAIQLQVMCFAWRARLGNRNERCHSRCPRHAASVFSRLSRPHGGDWSNGEEWPIRH